MKGEIFNILEGYVIENWGVKAFEKLYATVHDQLITKEPFVGPGTYPDQDFLIIVEEALELTGMEAKKMHHDLGAFALPLLLEKGASLVAEFKHPKELLLAVHDVIHIEVKKIYTDAKPPNFYYEDPAPDQLIMIYDSKRNLFDFFEGLIDGVARHFEMKIDCKRISKDYNNETFTAFHLTFSEPLNE